jgi:hypothetical protein
MSRSHFPARPSPCAQRPRSRAKGRTIATLRLASVLAATALIAGCATETADPVALNPAHYAWCNAERSVCTGWQGPGAFPAGETTPVGNWVIPAGDEPVVRPRFEPGHPVVEGEIADFY